MSSLLGVRNPETSELHDLKASWLITQTLHFLKLKRGQELPMFSYYQLDSTVSTKIWRAIKYRRFGKSPPHAPKRCKHNWRQRSTSGKPEKDCKISARHFCPISVAKSCRITAWQRIQKSYVL